MYENSESIILGKNLKEEEEIYLHKKPLRVLRRLSGGGSVVHFYGNLNYSIIMSLEKFPQLFPIHPSYHFFLGIIQRALANYVTLHLKGLSDLTIYNQGKYKKISGNSQARKKNWILHHGTFIYNLEQASKIGYYLKMPPKQPDYRANRKHNEFMIPIIPKMNKWKIMANIQTELSKTLEMPLKRQWINL